MASTRQWYDTEGGVTHRYTLEPNGRLTRERLQAGRSAHLEHNKRRQLEPESLNDREWGRMQASIPPNDYHRLLHKYPELKCWDSDVRSKAWDKWLASEEARPYLVREKA